MILVDNAGGVWPSINHSPWNGITLADFVMPFFLFIVGVALALAYRVSCSFQSPGCVGDCLSVHQFSSGYVWMLSGFRPWPLMLKPMTAEKNQQQEGGLTEGSWSNCETSNSGACRSRYLLFLQHCLAYDPKLIHVQRMCSIGEIALLKNGLVASYGLSSVFISVPSLFLEYLASFFISILVVTGGYFHGLHDLSYGVDLDRLRWCGVLQVLLPILHL